MGSRQSGHYPYVKDVQGMSIWEFTMFHGHLRRLKVTCLGSLWDGTVLSGLFEDARQSISIETNQSEQTQVGYLQVCIVFFINIFPV